MKEKLLALRAKLAPKVDPILARARAVWDRALPSLRRQGRWVSYLVLVPLGFALIAGMGFFWIYPAYELRPWITEKLATHLKAQSLRIGDMSWDHSLAQLSLGIELRNVEIQKGAWFNSLKSEELRFSFRPLALLSSGTPFNLEARGLDANVRLSSPRSLPAKPSAPLTDITPTSKSEQLVEWTRKLLSYAKGYRVRLHRSQVRLEVPIDSESTTTKNAIDLSLQDLELDAGLDASWRQKLHLKAVVHAGTQSGSWILAGPLSLDTRSVLSVRDGNIPVELNFSSFDLDLSETNFTGWGVFERFAPGRFAIQAKPRVIFREDNSQMLIGDFQSGLAQAYLDDLKIDINARYQPRKELELDWLVGRSEVKELHLPLKWLRRAPGQGIVSSTGRLHVRDRLDNSDFSWRLALNNFKLDSAPLASLWGDKKSSSGTVLISAVSEGHLRNGNLESPRTEIQIEATPADWSPPESFFVKPAGHKAQLLLRMSHDAEGLKISDLDAELHSMKLEGQGKVNNLLGMLASEQSADFELSLLSNNVDFSEWSALFPSFRKVPLQGLFQTKLNVAGSYNPRVPDPWTRVSWNFDKFHLSNVRGSFESGENVEISGLQQDLRGPFSLNFFFVGRGEGSRVHRATLISQLDLSGASIWLGDSFRKPQGVPFVLQLSADQTRNRVRIDKGLVKFANLDMNFSGDMVQGLGRSRLKVALKEPIDLASWKDFFPKLGAQERVRGRLWLDGSLGLDSNFASEKDIDWATLTFEGQSRFENFSWRSEIFGEAFDSMSGQLRFSERSIDFAPIEIRKGTQLYRLEGSLTPALQGLSKKPRSLYLIDWFLNPAWNLQANVKIPRVELASLLKKLESKDRYTFPDAWIDSKWARQSQANLNLDVDSLYWEGQEVFSKLLGRFEYLNGRSTLRPFSLIYKKGKITGSATLDVSPTWTQDGDPQWAASVNVDKLAVAELPFELGFARGTVKGEGTFTSQGRYYSDWEKAARLRGLLKVSGLQGDSWTKPLQSKVDAFFDKSAASDYLLSDAVRAECRTSSESALVEFQKTSEKLDLARVRISLKGRGRLDLQADVSGLGTAAGSKVRGKAVFKFPAKCFSDRAQFCMRELQRDVVWPLDFSKRDHALSDIEYDFDVLAFSKSFQLCMERRVSEDVRKQISSEKSAQ